MQFFSIVGFLTLDKRYVEKKFLRAKLQQHDKSENKINSLKHDPYNCDNATNNTTE